MKYILLLGVLLLASGCIRSNYSNYYRTEKQEIFGIDYSFDRVIYSDLPVRIGSVEAPLTLNPYRTSGPGEQFIATAVFSRLFRFNSRSKKIEKNLVHDYSISKDARLYNFFLKEDLKFSDGSVMTAADVIASLKLMEGVLKESSFYKDFYLHDNKLTFKLIKSDQFTIQLEKPNGNILYLLTGYPIIPKADAERLKTIEDFVHFYRFEKYRENGGEAQKVPVGSGPYRIAKIEPFSIELEKNPYYANQTAGGKELPAGNTIIFRYYKNSKDLLTEFVQGELDLVPLEQSHLESVTDYYTAGNRDFRIVETGYGSEHLMVLYNTFKKKGKPGLNSRDKRREIGRILLSIDDTYIEAQQAVFSTKEPEIDQKTSISDANGDLIAEDADGNALFFTVIAPMENEYLRSLADLVRKKLEKNYISVKLELLSMEEYLERLFYTYDYDIALISYSFTPSLSDYYTFFLGEKIGFAPVLESENAYAGVKELIETALADSPWTSGQYIQQLEDVLVDICQFYPVYRVKYYYLAKNGLYNLRIRQSYSEFIDIETIEHMIKLEE